MATYEIETDDGSVYQIETEGDIGSKPKSSNLSDLVKGAITPTVSSEQVLKTPIMRDIAATIPIAQMGMGLPRSNPISIPNFYKEGAEEVSSQSSPLTMATNAAIGLGLAGKAKMLPEIMGKNYTLKQATTGANALDTARTTLGEAKKLAISNSANKIVNNFKPTIPTEILRKLKNPIYEIEFSKSGAIKPTIGNLDKVKDALGDLLGSPKLWEEAPKKLQQLTKQLYGYVKDSMLSADETIKEPIEAYHKFMRKYNLVNKSLRDTQGNISEKRLRSAFNKEGERQTFEAWKELSKSNSDLKQVMKNMEKFTSRKEFKKIAGKVAGGGAIAYMMHRYLTDRLLGDKY